MTGDRYLPRHNSLWESSRIRQAILSALLLALLILATGGATARAQEERSRISRIRLGNPADVMPAVTGPSYFLQGNGAPDPQAFQHHIDQVANAPLDIVVLAASFPSGSSQTPECDELIGLDNVSSCETITILAASAANNAGATTAVNNAEIVYFAGGNQCKYVAWKGSTIHAAVQDVVARGGGVGGGSAGLAIQGEFIYNGCVNSVYSSEALSNPYHNFVTFSYDFFDWPGLEQVITDSHFVENNRMGRLMAFVARQIQDGHTDAAYGLGLDGGAAMVIDRDGLGHLYGGVAYVVLGDHLPEQCTRRKPLTFSNYKIWKLTTGDSYNFADRPTSGYYLRSVVNGVITGNPYNP